MYFRLSVVSQKKKDHSAASFQEDWLTKEEFEPWLRKVEKKPQKVYCIISSETIDIANGGSSALQSHQKGKMLSELVMIRNENRISNLFKKKSVDSTATTADKMQVVITCVKFPFIVSEDVLEDVLFSPLTSVLPVMQSSSMVFQRMFKTCPVVQQFYMKKDKARYMTVYGLYPDIKAKEQTKINASPWFSVSLDESLNSHQQKCQMDVNICYWDGKKNVAQSVYDNSQFLQRLNTVSLKEEILNAIKDLDRGKFLHLDRDGSSTN